MASAWNPKGGEVTSNVSTLSSAAAASSKAGFRRSFAYRAGITRLQVWVRAMQTDQLFGLDLAHDPAALKPTRTSGTHARAGAMERELLLIDSTCVWLVEELRTAVRRVVVGAQRWCR